MVGGLYLVVKVGTLDLFRLSSRPWPLKRLAPLCHMAKVQPFNTPHILPIEHYTGIVIFHEELVNLFADM